MFVSKFNNCCGLNDLVYVSIYKLTLLSLFHSKGPKALLRLSSKIFGSSDVIEENNGDAFAAHQRKCVHTMFGTFLLSYKILQPMKTNVC